MKWFTADLHFKHKNIIRFCNRPFSSVEEMDETLIKNWNECVSDSDIIYHLGDFCFGDSSSILLRLKGRIEFIKGSHDRGSKAPYLMNIVIEGIPVTLCHYAMRTWHRSHYNAFHLFGHSHGNLDGFGKSFDVGVDAWNYRPISWETVKHEMRNRPDNFNLVRRDNEQSN